MTTQIESIRHLKERGMSIRQIADQISITKYEVEKAFHQLKALGQHPDSRLDECLDKEVECLNDEDDESDAQPDTQTPVSGQYAFRSSAQGKSPADLPSEWHSGVTRYDADFIVENYLEDYTPVEIKALYEDKYPLGYMSLSDIHRVIQAYQLEEDRQRKVKLAAELEKDRQNEIKLATKKATDQQTFRQFNNFVGEDALAFLLWVNDVEEWETAETKSCVVRAGIIISEVENFCRTHKLAHGCYEPYAIISAIKDALNTALRKRDEPEFDNKVFSFVEMLAHRPSLDRYFWKMFDSSGSSWNP